MKKIKLALLLFVFCSCGKTLTDKEVCEQDWQFMSDGTRQKCANDRLIEAMMEMHKPMIIHDTIYISR